MIGGMKAARNLRIAIRRKGANASAANIQSSTAESKACGSSTLAPKLIEAANVVTAIAIAGRLARIVVVAVLGCVQVRSIQHYAEHGSLNIRQNFHASGQCLAGGCATAADKNNAVDHLRQDAALRIGNDRWAVHHYKSEFLPKGCNGFFDRR